MARATLRKSSTNERRAYPPCHYDRNFSPETKPEDTGKLLCLGLSPAQGHPPESQGGAQLKPRKDVSLNSPKDASTGKTLHLQGYHVVLL